MKLDRILEGHFALVTGGSRGIGRAMAESLAGAGCNVAIASRHLKGSQVAADEIGEKTGCRALGVQCDVSQSSQVRRLFQEIRRWSEDRLDVLACNAGYPFLKEIWNTPLHQTPADQIEAWYMNLFRTDTLGSVLCTHEALPLMIEQRRGSIIYVSSTPALEGFQGTPYTVAKAGVLGLMKDIACAYGQYNIRANALALGNILTPATFDQLDPASRQRFAEETPLKRWGECEEVARATLFLASPMSSFITGQTLVIDGGTVRW